MAVKSSLGLTTKMPAIWLHEKAYEIIGTRVTHAIAECIPQTRDSNRGYQERLDFVIYRTDGTRCRLHPGKRPSLDAKLIYYQVMG